jgi:formylglycine-generating enzyme required for sulfatase activity
MPTPNAAPLTTAQERGLNPKDTFRECNHCPEMVVVPAGRFMMGSPVSEMDRKEDEGPHHMVTIGKPFAVGNLHVTVDQFAAFVREAGYDTGSGCYTLGGRGIWHPYSDKSWRNPGFAQDGSHPVVCVSRNDAKAYTDWLAKKTGKPYRLLSEAEWEYAARGRTSPGAYPRFWFGDDEKALCHYGNGADQKARESKVDARVALCDDGYVYTSPAGHYEPNAFGLHDMFGNAAQWVEDCYHISYEGAPADGSAWTTECIGSRMLVRGGSWAFGPEELSVARRESMESAWDQIGFRVARTLISP